MVELQARHRLLQPMIACTKLFERILNTTHPSKEPGITFVSWQTMITGRVQTCHASKSQPARINDPYISG
jgi:hypothetical protein